MPDRRALPPRDGDEWRMDFSRFNQYKEAPPAKDPGGWAWSPHGVWDSHIPELFTRVRFSTEPVGQQIEFRRLNPLIAVSRPEPQAAGSSFPWRFLLVEDAAVSDVDSLKSAWAISADCGRRL